LFGFLFSGGIVQIYGANRFDEGEYDVGVEMYECDFTGSYVTSDYICMDIENLGCEVLQNGENIQYKNGGDSAIGDVQRDVG